MDEEEIEVLEAGVVQGLVDLLDGDVVGYVAIEDLGGKEDVGARDAGGLDGGAAGSLVAVDEGGIDVSVADFQGMGDGVIGLVYWAVYCC